MQQTTLTLEEVVVIGYGSQKKESMVAAIAQTTNAELQKSGNVADLSQALTGHLPGVVTITMAGEPGGVSRGFSSTQVYIRGQNTWNGGQALILVDGVERGIDNLDMSEVENISVLKDASATAVFGVKGANGVILVTTKRGSTGKPKLSFTYNSTMISPSKLPTKFNSYDAQMARNESIEREAPLSETSWQDFIPYDITKRYQQPQSAADALIFPDVDWKDATFKNAAYSHRATLNVQGGTNFVKYFGSLSYMHEADMFKDYENNHGYEANYNYDRYNFRSNLDFRLTKTTNLKVNLSGYFSQKNTNYNNEGFSGWNADSWMWLGVYGFPPDLYFPQYADGRFGYSPNISAYTMNPAAAIHNLGVRKTYTTELNSDFALEQKLDFITKGLSFTASLFYDNTMLSEDGIYDVTNHVRPVDGGNVLMEYLDPALYIGPDQDPTAYTKYYPVAGTNQFDYVVRPWSLRTEAIAGGNWVWTVPVDRRLLYQFQLNYGRRFGLHNVSALGLFKREQSASGSVFPYYREDWVFRAAYDYNSKYLFEMNGAYNGSEQFGPGYRFAFFPSIGLGWVVSNEKFFTIDWINRLKVRYSVGKVGDDKVSGGRWQYADQFSYGAGVTPPRATFIGTNPTVNSPYKWYSVSQVGNPDIHWEEALKNNYGIELSVFRSLFSVTYEYFTEHRTDILIPGSQRNIPAYFGAAPPPANLGIVDSHGSEVELRLDKTQNNGFHFWSTFAYTHTMNEVIERDDPELVPDYLKAQGYKINQTRSQIRNGFYNNWDDIYASVPRETNDLLKLPGFYNVLDFNADGIIKSADDSEPIGYSDVPEHTYNFSMGADYKGFSVMFQLYGVNNVTRNMSLSSFSGQLNILFDRFRDYWSEDNMDADAYLPRWRVSGATTGDFWLWDASYLRLKTAEISYTFQEPFLKKTKLGGVRIFLNGNNLLFWSELPDDREGTALGNTGAAGGPGTGSASGGAYPTSRRINLGVDLTF